VVKSPLPWETSASQGRERATQAGGTDIHGLQALYLRQAPITDRGLQALPELDALRVLSL
jgi:hypothetical protein